MFQIAVLRQRALLDQHDGHRPHIHRPDAQTDGNHEQVVGKGKGPDHPIERERGIQNLQIKKSPQPALGGGGHGLLALVQQAAQRLHHQKGDQPVDRR